MQHRFFYCNYQINSLGNRKGIDKIYNYYADDIYRIYDKIITDTSKTSLEVPYNI